MEVDISNFIIKKGDTLPLLKLTIIDRACLGDKIPFNMDSVTAVTFTMKDECGNFKILNQNASIVSSSGGTIQYAWSNIDTDESGNFLGEFRLSFSGGTRMTLPAESPIRIHIPKTLNNF